MKLETIDKDGKNHVIDIADWTEIILKSDNKELRIFVQDFNYSEIHLKLTNEGYYELKPITLNELNIRSIR